jgi:hypothetical protein
VLEILHNTPPMSENIPQEEKQNVDRCISPANHIHAETKTGSVISWIISV